MTLLHADATAHIQMAHFIQTNCSFVIVSAWPSFGGKNFPFSSPPLVVDDVYIFPTTTTTMSFEKSCCRAQVESALLLVARLYLYTGGIHCQLRANFLAPLFLRDPTQTWNSNVKQSDDCATRKNANIFLVKWIYSAAAAAPLEICLINNLTLRCFVCVDVEALCNRESI